MKPRSHEVTDGKDRAPARAMLRAVGMTDDDWDKPQVGVASSWNEVTPCNLPLDRLAKRSKEGVRRRRRLPDRVHHHRGLRRHLHGPRGHAGLAGQPRGHRRLRRDGDARRAPRRAGHASPVATSPCPACSWPRPGSTCRRCSSTAARSCPGNHNGAGARHRHRVRGRRRACRGHRSPRTSSTRSSAAACPTEGSCAGMFTANTMASVGEALGMSLPGSAVAAGGRPSPRRLRLRERPGRDRPAAARTSGPARS